MSTLAEERMSKTDDRRGKQQNDDPWSSLGARLAVGGVLTVGALASGFLVSRRGRRLVADTFRGAKRTPLADRVLDRFFDEPALARRRLDVEEPRDGMVVVVGAVANERELALALEVAGTVHGVQEVGDRLVVDPTLVRRRVRSGKDLVKGR